MSAERQSRLDRLIYGFSFDRDGTRVDPASVYLDGFLPIVLAALGDGGRTFQVAARLGWGTQRTRKVLFRLEEEGLVKRDLLRCASNDLRWVPVNSAACLRARATGGSHG